MEDWQKALLNEVQQEVKAQSSIHNHFKYVRFISKSKGRGRKRKHWKEVELVKYVGTTRCPLWQKFPFDIYATEVLPGWDEWNIVETIQDELRTSY